MRNKTMYWMLSLLAIASVVSCSSNDFEVTSISDTNTGYTFLVEGKRWNYTWGRDSHMSIFVKGDTIVAGKVCKKLYRQLFGENASLYMVLYEENGKVCSTQNYTHYPRNGTLIYDFSMQKGESLEITMADRKEEWYVTDTFTSMICGNEYRILRLTAPSGYQVTWISGIGNYYMSLHNAYHMLSDRAHLISVEVGSKTIFTEDEYQKKVPQPEY